MIFVLNNKNFGRNIAFLREQENMSREALADLLDTCPEILEEIEEGNQLDIEYEMMEVLEDAFHTDVGSLIHNEMWNQ